MDAVIPPVEPDIRKVMVFTNFVDICQSLAVEPTALCDYLGNELQSPVHVDPLNQLIFDMPNVKSLDVRKAISEARDPQSFDLTANQFREAAVNAVVRKGMVLANYAKILSTLNLEDSNAQRKIFVAETNSGVHLDGRGGLVFEGNVTVAKITSAVQRLRNWRHIRPADSPPPDPAPPSFQFPDAPPPDPSFDFSFDFSDSPPPSFQFPNSSDPSFDPDPSFEFSFDFSDSPPT